MLLPNLKHLSLSCYMVEQSKNFRPSKGGLSEMFFSKKGVAPANYDFLQHLKIESLDFSGQFANLFLNLPHLRRLRLGAMTNLELTPTVESNLTHVEMHLALEEEYTGQEILSRDLKILLTPSVRHITAHLALSNRDLSKGTCVTNVAPLFETLLHDLHEMVPDLETFVLKPKFAWDPSGQLPLIASPFYHLKRVAIHCQPHKDDLSEMEAPEVNEVKVVEWRAEEKEVEDLQKISI